LAVHPHARPPQDGDERLAEPLPGGVEHVTDGRSLELDPRLARSLTGGRKQAEDRHG
jgi:hypothetical protein